MTSGFTDEVIRIDPSNGSIVSRIPTERRRDEVDEPHAVAVSPDGMHWYVTVAHGEPTLWKFELEGDRLVGRVTLPTAGPEAGPPGQPALKPLNLAWAADGRTIYVSLNLAGSVRAFRADGTIVGTVDTGSGPAQIALTPDGRTLVVANRGGASLSVVDAATLVERARIPLGAEHPHGVAVDAAGRRAFVSCEGTPETAGRAVAVDLESETVLWSVEAGAYTLGTAFVPGRGE